MESPSIVTAPSSRFRRVAGNPFTKRVLITFSAAAIPARCSSVNRFALPAQVVDAGVGIGSNSCPATSWRRRSSPTMKSAPASCAEAIVINTCPGPNPRSRCLIGPIPASKAAVIPNARSSSRTTSTPAAPVNRGSDAPIRTRRVRTRRCPFESRIVATEKVPSLTDAD